MRQNPLKPPKNNKKKKKSARFARTFSSHASRSVLRAS